MAMRVHPGKVDGAAEAPPSKSLTLRALAAASLAKGKSEIIRPASCDDARAMADCARALGATVEEQGDTWLVTGGSADTGTLRCGESGFALRALAAVAALRSGPFTLEASGSLASRSVAMLAPPLELLGARVTTDGGRRRSGSRARSGAGPRRWRLGRPRRRSPACCWPCHSPPGAACSRWGPSPAGRTRR